MDREQFLAYEKARKTWGDYMQPVPEDEWNLRKFGQAKVIAQFRSKDHTAIVWDDGFELDYSTSRLSVFCNRIDRQTGRFRQDITWDDLQRIKCECGFGLVWAVEVFPPENKQVNVNNMRHLWLVSKKPEFAGWDVSKNPDTFKND